VQVARPPGLPLAATEKPQATLRSRDGRDMETSEMFVDCPAYMDNNGANRCGLPAAVADRYTMTSTDGPLQSARTRCPRGHWFNGPLESLASDSGPLSYEFAGSEGP
jgi:hypothetical protein